MGVDVVAECLFGPRTEAILREPIYVAGEFGEYTLVRLLEALRRGSLRRDIVSIPNLVLATKDGSWHATPTVPEPVNLNEDYTRWDLVDRVPPCGADPDQHRLSVSMSILRFYRTASRC